MRPPFLWALLVVAAGAVLLGRPTNPGAGLPPEARARSGKPSAEPRLPSPPTLPEAPRRNVFQYGDDDVTARPLTPAVTSQPPALLPPSQPTVRLVGLLQRGNQPRAAIWIAGTVVVLAVGEEAEGYRLLGLSDDEGVRLRSPSGEEITLGPPGS